MNHYQQQKQREKNMEKQGTIIVAITLAVVWIPSIVIVFLAVGHASALILAAVALALAGLGFLLSKSYWNKVEAEKERINALKDLPSELDASSSENL